MMPKYENTRNNINIFHAFNQNMFRFVKECYMRRQLPRLNASSAWPISLKNFELHRFTKWQFNRFSNMFERKLHHRHEPCEKRKWWKFINEKSVNKQKKKLKCLFRLGNGRYQRRYSSSNIARTDVSVRWKCYRSFAFI